MAVFQLEAVNYVEHYGLQRRLLPNGGRVPAQRPHGHHAGKRGSLRQPVVVAEMATNIHSLTVSEAVMRLDLADLPALLFRNAAHGGLNMIYRRGDGNIGWVDPQGNQGT